MIKAVSILGSTGSIGRQSIAAAKHLGVPVVALTANKKTDLVEQQARELKPKFVAIFDENAAKDLKTRLADTDIRVGSGMEGLIEAATLNAADCVVTAVSGSVGLKPTLAAISEKKRIALANKETLVCAGEIVMPAAKAAGAEIVPVDSEHSAIFQCLMGRAPGELKKILLTGSGGPFRGKSRAELENVTPEQAVKHPNWSMGAKISVDSATMMNKGLEFIEAMHLFGVTPDDIQVVVHPQSIVHSMVEFKDGAVLAQLGTPDMRLPIRYAMTYPERGENPAPPLDLLNSPPLTFLEPDRETFPCLRLAEEAAEAGGTACAILNGANEEAVRLFLAEKIGFYDISDLVAAARAAVPVTQASSLEDILSADHAAREAVQSAFARRHS